MEKRTLGRSEIKVTPLCFGGNVFGWTADEATSFDILDTFLEEGGDFIDTADVYSRWAPGHQGGESETVMGRWLKNRNKRDKVIIATKLGSPMGEHAKGLSRRYMMEAVEASLRRLQTDYIDLYQAHIDDQDTALEETLAAFNELITQGKVRAIGASNYTAGRLSEALSVSKQHNEARYESIQPPYSLANRSVYEGSLEELCLKEDVGVITYSSLASGFLTGKYRAGTNLPGSPRAQGVKKNYMNERGFAILNELDRIAARYDATITQVALAWIIARPGITAPIASTTSIAQTRELMGSLKLQLDKASIEALDRVSATQ